MTTDNGILCLRPSGLGACRCHARHVVGPYRPSVVCVLVGPTPIVVFTTCRLHSSSKTVKRPGCVGVLHPRLSSVPISLHTRQAYRHTGFRELRIRASVSGGGSNVISENGRQKDGAYSIPRFSQPSEAYSTITLKRALQSIESNPRAQAGCLPYEASTYQSTTSKSKHGHPTSLRTAAARTTIASSFQSVQPSKQCTTFGQSAWVSAMVSS